MAEPRPIPDRGRRVLVHVPGSRDAERIATVLRASGLDCVVCRSVSELWAEIATGGAVAVLTEEALLSCLDDAARVLGAQPKWSALPLVVLTRSNREGRHRALLARLAANITLVERPVRIRVLVSVVCAGLRAREHQYELRDAIEALQSAEERLRLTLDSVTDYAIFNLDLAGRVSSWNPGAQRVFGWSEEEIVGRDASILFTPADRASGALEHEMRRARLEGRAEDERWHLRKDGSKFVASGILTPMADRAGATVGYTEVARDITDRKRAEEAQREADRRKDEFLATLAHELRNPLAPIRTGLHVVKLTPSGSPEAARALGMMDRQLTHMVRLIDDLLDLSRIRRGTVELRTAPIELRQVVDTALEASRAALEVGRHDLTVSVSEPVWVRGDLTRLAQVLGNVLTNAAKYTPDGGRIVIRAGRDGEDAIISVSDVGMGIPRHMLDAVFDMFTQLEGSVDRSQGGLGIGLALSRKLVQLHGGSIVADSPGVGRGSTFTIRLPAIDPPAASPTVPGPSSGPDPGLLRILVVDDNVDAAEALGMSLELGGHEVRTAHDGTRALDSAVEFDPHLVFLDIGLPDVDGYEVARRLRRDPKLHDVVLVALTGWGAEEDKRQSREAGFDLHLTKPVDPADVEGVVARYAPRAG